MTVQEQLDAAFRIRRAVCQLSEGQPSHARSIIDQFLKFISPSMARAYGDEFPVTCRRQPGNPERGAFNGMGGKWPLLYFHIGNAILGLYDGVKGIACPTMDERIGLIEDIARFGLDAYRVEGDESRGFTLMLIMKTVAAEGDSNGVHQPTETENEHDDAGGRDGVRRAGAELLLRSGADGSN